MISDQLRKSLGVTTYETRNDTGITEPARNDTGTKTSELAPITERNRNDTGTGMDDIAPNPVTTTSQSRDEDGANIDKLFRLDRQGKIRRKRIETQMTDAEHAEFLAARKYYGVSSAAMLRVAFKIALPQLKSNMESGS